MDLLPLLTPATPAMAAPIAGLVQLSFVELAARDWAPGGCRHFLGDSPPDTLADALRAPTFAAVEADEGGPVGFILLRRPTRLDMLFVHPDRLRQGIARRLWQAARQHLVLASPAVTTVELDATPYAVKAYQALGFAPIGPQVIHGGGRAIRMACRLDAPAEAAHA